MTYDQSCLIRESPTFLLAKDVIKLRTATAVSRASPQPATAAIVRINRRVVRKEHGERMLPTSTIDGPMEFTLRLIGVWPDSSCKILQPAVWTTVMMAWQIFQYWYLFTHIGSESLPELSHMLSLCLSNSLLFLKLNVLWLNRR